MFKDLREFAENEESLKAEVQECRAKKLELEASLEEMQNRYLNKEG
jgi:predicted RNase H-like nuclease (RuvC/YqgF family)